MALFKLICRNVRKNIRDYLIYFVTLMLSVSLFYAFNVAAPSVFKTLNTNVEHMANESGLREGLQKTLHVASIFITGMLAFLMVYANQFLLKRRKKEMGLYVLLGMNKWKISFVFIGETFLVGLLSLAFGFAAGVPLSQGLSILALRFFGGDINKFQLVFSLPVMIQTMISFAAIYMMVMLANVWNISKQKVINLLRAERKNQGMGTVKRFFSILGFLGAVGLFLLAVKASSQWKEGFPDGQTAISIMIGTIGGTVLTFYSAFTVGLSVAKARKNVYLKNLNTFLFRQIESRVYTNFFSVSVVCLLLSATILLTVIGFSASSTIDKLAEEALISDVSIRMDTKKLGNTDVLERAKEHGVDLKPHLKHSIQLASYRYENGLTYSTLFKGQTANPEEYFEGFDKGSSKKPIRLVSISDYNKVLKFAGTAPLEMNENEFLMHSQAKGLYDKLRSFLQDVGHITVAGQRLKAGQTDLLKYSWGLGEKMDPGTIVIPDSVAGKLRNAEMTLLANYKSSVDAAAMESVVYRLTNENGDPTKNALHDGFSGTTKYLQKSETMMVSAMPFYVCLYLGVVFLIICVTMLALQQLTETANNAKRYGLLRKLGADNDMLKSTLRKQIGVYFTAPLLLAGVTVTAGVQKVVSIVNKAKFFSFELSINVIPTMLIFILVYGGYYVATYFSCKRILLEHSNQ